MAAEVRDGLRLAAGTLTIIPVTPPERIDRAVARVAMLTGSLVVLPVSLAAALIGWCLIRLGVPSPAAGLVVVGLLLLGTRAIHADGVADTADGLGASWDRDKALTVMRQGDVGPMGAATLVVLLGIQSVCASEVLSRPLGWLQAGVLFAAGRVALTLGTRKGVPASRPEGLGNAVAGSVPTWQVLLAWTILTAVVVPLSLLDGSWWGGPLGVILAAGACLGLLELCRHRFGGITGDILGALVEIATTCLILGASC